MTSIELDAYPSTETYAAFWVRLSFLSTLAASQRRFVWEPVGSSPELLNAYARHEGIDESPKGLTYFLIGDELPEKDATTSASLKSFVDQNDLETIPMDSESLITALFREEGVDALQPSIRPVAIHIAGKTIAASMNIDATARGLRAVCTFADYDFQGMQIHDCLPMAKRRGMEVSHDGIVHYGVRTR